MNTHHNHSWCNDSSCRAFGWSGQWEDARASSQETSILIFFIYVSAYSCFMIPFCQSKKAKRVAGLRGVRNSCALALIAVVMGYCGISSITTVNFNIVLAIARDCRWWSFFLASSILTFCHFMLKYIERFYKLYHKHRVLGIALEVVTSKLTSRAKHTKMSSQARQDSTREGFEDIKEEEENIIDIESPDEKVARKKSRRRSSLSEMLKERKSSVTETRSKRKSILDPFGTNARASILGHRASVHPKRSSQMVPQGRKTGAESKPTQPVLLEDPYNGMGFIMRTYRKIESQVRIIAYNSLLDRLVLYYSLGVSFPVCLLPHAFGYAFGFEQTIGGLDFHSEVSFHGVVLCVYDTSYLLATLGTCLLCVPYVMLCSIMGVSIFENFKEVGTDVYGIRTSLTRTGISMFLALMFYGTACVAAVYMPGALDYLAGCVAFMGVYMYVELVVMPTVIAFEQNSSIYIPFISSSQSSVSDISLNWRKELPGVEPTVVLEEFLERNDESIQAMLAHLKSEMNSEILAFYFEVTEFKRMYSHLEATIQSRKLREKELSKLQANCKVGEPRISELERVSSGDGGHRQSCIDTSKIIEEAESLLKGVENSNAVDKDEVQVPDQSSAFLSNLPSTASDLDEEEFKEDMSKMIDEAEEIAEKYLRVSSPFQVNLPHNILQVFATDYVPYDSSMPKDFRQNPCCFDNAKQEIMKSLVFDSLPRFLNIPRHQSLWSLHINALKEEFILDDGTSSGNIGKRLNAK